MKGGAEPVHVVFGRSIADTVREALPLLGSTERVIGMPGLLSVGPIDPPDPALRRAWCNAVLRADAGLHDDLDGDPAEMATAWAEATAPGIAPVFWACLSSPMEHACFLAFAARMQDRSFDLVDATELDVVTVGGVQRPCSLGQMRVQDIVASKVYAARRPLPAKERDAASRTWLKLQQENAPFRIVQNGQMVSAPPTLYDAFLIEQASQDWEIAVRLIGRAITALSFENTPPGHATSDAVLFGRMLALGEEGALEITGAGPGMRDYRVRRALASLLDAAG